MQPELEVRMFATESASSSRRAGKREVDLYIRTYTTLLQSSGVVAVASLEPAHIGVASALHAGATEAAPDMSAFIYSTQRLPACIVDVRHILLGQNASAFAQAGYGDITAWELQTAPGRRREWHFDGQETLAATIASTSDLDDLIPTIVAYQIEWNKMHRLIRADDTLSALVQQVTDPNAPDAVRDEDVAAIGAGLLLSPTDWARLRSVWSIRWKAVLSRIAHDRKRYSLRMFGGAYTRYNRAARLWWQPVLHLLRERGLENRPVYFVSSNGHSHINVLSGVAMRRKEKFKAFIEESQHAELLPEMRDLEAGTSRSSWENLLYFAARPYFDRPGMEDEWQQRIAEEEAIGITNVDPGGGIDVGVQVIEIDRLDPTAFDRRLCDKDAGEQLDPSSTNAIIININYPLGLAAYHILSQISMSMEQVRGIYILGKAATLNARIGDVMLANSVYDEHSGNTYWFDNCFTYESLAPYLVFGAALDNQKAVTVRGTYLQNEGYLDFYYRENYTVVEMEAGPYLNAIYEDRFLNRYPEGEAINLSQHGGDAFDLGIIHYASDTPYTRAQTLGARGMSFHGMDSTYASTIAILRRIFTQSGVLKLPS
jgi:hypothetical protein